jgi:thioredoxin-like negative regulator of GroEL
MVSASTYRICCEVSIFIDRSYHEECAEEYDGQIYIYKVDTEAEQQLAAEFGIRSIPSLLFVPMGEAPQMAQGALPKDAFKQAIEEVLLKN